MAQWSGEELRDCTRYGILWSVRKIRSDGALGCVRVRRSGEFFYLCGKLQWKRVKEGQEKLDIEVGDVLFMSHDKAVSCLKPTKEVRERILG